MPSAHPFGRDAEYEAGVRGGLVLHGGQEIYWLGDYILAPSLAFARDFARRYFTELCHLGEAEAGAFARRASRRGTSSRSRSG